jgi:hypothetical protein
VLEAVAAHNVNTLIYSSTCATYGEPDTMPIVEITPQVGPLMHELLNISLNVMDSIINSILTMFQTNEESDQSIWKGQEDGRGHHLRFLKVKGIEHGCHDFKV